MASRLERPKVFNDFIDFAQVLQESPLILPQLPDDKHGGVPGAMGWNNGVLGQLFSYQGLQRMQLLFGKGPQINPNWMILFPVEPQGVICMLLSGPN